MMLCCSLKRKLMQFIWYEQVRHTQRERIVILTVAYATGNSVNRNDTYVSFEAFPRRSCV